MSSNCMVLFCGNKGKQGGISYFRLTPSRYEKWMQALGFDPKSEKMSTCNYICSSHFHPDDISISPRGKKILKAEAVPCLNLGPNAVQRRTSFEAAEMPRHMDIPTTTSTPACELIHDKSANVVKLSMEEVIEAVEFNINEPVMEVEVTTEMSIDADDEWKSVASASTLTCFSTEAVFDRNNLFYLLMFIQMVCLSIMQNPGLLHCPTSEDNMSKPKAAKRKFDEVGGSFSSADSLGLRGSPKNRRKDLRTVHNYYMSPRRLLQQVKEQTEQKKKIQKKLYTTNRRISRLRKKVTCLKQITKELYKKRFMSNDALDVLTKSFSGIPLSMMSRVLQNLRNSKKGLKQPRTQFPKELRSFAMTLLFYSTKAYEYVRKTFHLCLPSQSVIRSWLSNINCEPGFNMCSFESIKSIVKENCNKNEPTLCALVMDEMAIRKQIDFIGGKSWGYVNFGTDIEDDNLDCAKEAFVLLVVSLKQKWKLPIAYFFVKSLTSEEKANLVLQAVTKLNEVGVTITSLTCDGPAPHFKMAKILGADFSNIFAIKSYFLHPISKSKIYIIFDPCHMIKLIRNNWAYLKTIIDVDGNTINFQYITSLYELQESEQFRFGTKLKQAHIKWQSQIMKVNLAAQTISQSVATAIETLNDDFNYPQFEGAGPTVKFLRLFDMVFDLMNSRNPFGRGSKTPLKVETEEQWLPLLEEAKMYIPFLKNQQGVGLYRTKNKTPFLGFLINISSYVGMYQEYVKKDNAPLKYILTYKTSQDHLELFFCSIRARNGWNNNPSAFQFYHSYKRLVVNLDIKGLSGNAIALDETNILNVTKNNSLPYNILTVDDISIIKKYDLDLPNEIELDETIISFLPDMSILSENIVVYIAGFVVRKIKQITYCNKCKYILEQEHESTDDANFKLFNRKNRGGLLRPSSDVIYVCLAVEKKLRHIYNLNGKKVPNEKNFFQTFVTGISNQIIQHKSLFKGLDDNGHIFDHCEMDNLYLKLTKMIVTNYTKVRIYSLCKKQTELIKGDVKRKTLSKIILFSGQ